MITMHVYVHVSICMYFMYIYGGRVFVAINQGWLHCVIDNWNRALCWISDGGIAINYDVNEYASGAKADNNELQALSTMYCLPHGIIWINDIKE